jgi:hypothetical protein
MTDYSEEPNEGPEPKEDPEGMEKGGKGGANYAKLCAVVDKVKAAADPSWHNGVYNQTRFAFGFDWNSRIGKAMSKEDMPDFAPIDTNSVEVGAMRQVFVNQVVAVTTTLQDDPRPTFPQLDEFYDELRRQAFMNWWTQKNMATVAAEGFVSGYGVGVGFTRFFFTRTLDGHYEPDARNVPAYDVVWDPFEADPRRARWIGFNYDVDVPDALEAWPDKHELLEKCKTKRVLSDGKEVDRIRVFEYWEREYRGVFIGSDFSADNCLAWEQNPFRNKPRYCAFASMVYLTVPGIQRPIGTVLMQMSNAAELKIINEHIRAIAMQRPLNFWDSDQVNMPTGPTAKTLTDFELKGDSSDRNLRNPLIRIPAEEISQTLMAYMSKKQAELDSESYTTKDQRGVAPSSGVTAFAEQNYQASVAQLGSWRRKKLLEYLRDFVDVWTMCAEVGYTAPVMLDFQGRNIPFNVPNDPRSSLALICSEPSSVQIDPASIDASDEWRAMAMKLDKLDRIKDLAISGTVKQAAWVEEMLLTLGFNDLSKWIPSPEEMPATPGATAPGVVDPMGVTGDPSGLIPA